jgi:hypothetical protein
MGMVLGPTVAKSLGFSSKTSTSMTSSPSSSQIPLSNLGNSTSLQNAEETVGFPVALPSSLPLGTLLSDVRVPADGKLVTLLYGNPALQSLSIYQAQVAITISQSPDRITNAAPAYLPQGFVSVNVGGAPGFARAPFDCPGMPGMVEPGQLQWWKNGIRYSMFSNLSIEQMTSIAESMRTVK